MSARTEITRPTAPTPPAARGRGVGGAAPAWPPSLRRLSLRQPGADDLLGVVRAGRDDRVLALGEASAEVLCDALRRGCRGGSAFRAAPARPEAAEVVVAPAIRTEEAGQAVVACARRALPPGGRLALRAIGQGAAALASAIAGRLRAGGFEAVRLRRRPEGALVVCRLPAAGAVGR